MSEATTTDRAIALYGTDEPTTPTRLLTAGALTAELEDGALRYVRLGGTEVLRAIAFLVRDENWGTFTPTIADLEIDERPDGFTVTYRATCADAKRSLVYDARITGSSDGSLAFEAVAEPVTDVETNRAGFVVLHPIEGVAGRPVKVLHVDGRLEEAVFPETIDPKQPFHDIRALTHEVAPGLWATCTMEGDSWEMEDHRNWCDASYKTYVRPLALPWPYTLKKGETVTQSVQLTVSGPIPAAVAEDGDRPVSLRIGAETGERLPAIGIGVPAAEAGHALETAALLKRLGPKLLVCQTDLRRGHGREALEAYRRLGAETGAEIVLEIITTGALDPATELKPLGDAAREAGLAPAAVTVVPAQHTKSVLPGTPWPDMPSFEALYGAARAAFPGARLGGGMATYFTELNRMRPPAALIDFVTYTTCPIVHAADDRSVMETHEALAHQVLSTRAFMGDIPRRIGPSAIGCRENPYGAAATPNPQNGRVCLAERDPRQRGLFNAAWALGYVATLARSGVEAVSLGAPTGPFGAIHRRSDHPQPYYDARQGPAVYPVFHVVAGLAEGSDAPLLEARHDGYGRIDALAFRAAGETVVWIANLTAAPQSVEIAGVAASEGRLSLLDAAAFATATTDPDAMAALARPHGDGAIALDAYAVARLAIPA